MHPVMIEAQNIGKKYRIVQGGYITLRDVLARCIRDPLASFRKKINATYIDPKDFWVLKGVSFKINQGEIVGIIGKNGAGKSTLLKILTRITPPTEGEARIRGKIAALLEVGTGFHSELTGKENIFVNGAILGMTKREIIKNFDEIVEFAGEGVKKFLNMPVKRYSSGMLVRLAFSIAAHLEPDILFIDEVLAVGDDEFQKKCLGKLENIRREKNKTIFFVSHNTSAIQQICDRCLLLSQGKLVKEGKSADVLEYYLNNEGRLNISTSFLIDDTKEAYIETVGLFNENGFSTSRFATYENIYIEIRWTNREGVPITPNIKLINQAGISILLAFDTPADFTGHKKKEKGHYLNRFKIPAHLLNSNYYYLDIALNYHGICYDYKNYALGFSVWDPMDDKCIARGDFKGIRDDIVLWPALECSYEKISK